MTNPESLLKLVDARIEEYRSGLSDSNLYSPIAYMMGLGGKRMRPVLTLLGCELFEGRAEDALEPALAIEVFHNFTLLHDDIMDNAPVRRGLPTVFKKWGTSSAILSGDVMSIHACHILAEMNHPRSLDVIRELNRAAIEVCEGQQMDMDFEMYKSVDLDQYIEMIRLKTACLLAGALRMGAIVAGAPEADTKLISDFGENMGIAFQIMDDYLDVFGDQEKVGKQTGGDIIAGKKTFLVLEALALSHGTEREEFSELISDRTMEATSKVEKVIAIYRKLGVPEATLKAADNYVNRAMEALNSIAAPDHRKQVILEYLNTIARRQH
ncbi:MAG: hypothetical protein RL220_1321 [Bacteroidota bacterium]|jgi:geranylgeranyl diphosphate synthase type II